MDILDFVPFLGFIRNDEETISIMAEASVVIPKVCDILGISLSYSESDEESGESGGRDEGRTGGGSSTPSTPDSTSSLVTSTPSTSAAATASHSRSPSSLGQPSSSSMTLASLLTSHAKDEDGQSLQLQSTATRKRRVDSHVASASSPTPRGQLAPGHRHSHGPRQSTASTAIQPPSSTTNSQLLLPPKKRRVQQNQTQPTFSTSVRSATTTTSTSATTSQTDSEVYEDPIRQKLRQDVDIFNDKIRQLAALERQKNRLLENLLTISASLTSNGGDGGHSLQDLSSSSSGAHDDDEEEDEAVEEQEDQLENLDSEAETGGDLETETDIDTDPDPDHDIETESDSQDSDLETDLDYSELEEDDPEDDDQVLEVEEVVTTEVVEEQIVPFDTIHLIHPHDETHGVSNDPHDLVLAGILEQ